jgi:hypothetical protein
MLIGDIRYDEQIETASVQLLPYGCEPLLIF